MSTKIKIISQDEAIEKAKKALDHAPKAVAAIYGIRRGNAAPEYYDTPLLKYSAEEAAAFQDAMRRSSKGKNDVIVYSLKQRRNESCELDEEKLDEKIPFDLSKAYKKANFKQPFADFEFTDPIYLDTKEEVRGEIKPSRRNNLIDFEKATYEKLTPEEAITYYKQNRNTDELRFIIDNYLVVPAINYFGTRRVSNGEEYVKKNGDEINDPKYMPLTHLVKIASAIYKTDEDKFEKPRERQTFNVADTGDHDFFRHSSYSISNLEPTIKKYQKDIDKYENRVAQYEQSKANAEDKLKSNDLSETGRNALKSELNHYDRQIKYYKQEIEDRSKYIEQARQRIRNVRAYLNNLPAALDLNKVRKQFTSLKSNLDDLEDGLERSQRKANDPDASNYAFYQKMYKEITEKIIKLQQTLEDYSQYLNNDAREAEAARLQSEIDNYVKSIAAKQAEIAQLMKPKATKSKLPESLESKHPHLDAVIKELNSPIIIDGDSYDSDFDFVVEEDEDGTIKIYDNNEVYHYYYLEDIIRASDNNYDIQDDILEKLQAAVKQDFGDDAYIDWENQTAMFVAKD